MTERIIKDNNLDNNLKIHYLKTIAINFLEYAKNNGINVQDLEDKFHREINHYINDPTNFKDFIGTYITKINKRISLNKMGEDTNIIKPNGKIDKNYYQGKLTGDCWLLAAIKSIAMNPKGLKILNNLIKVNSDGSVCITLKGVNKTYTISKEELEANTDLATGDGDVRAIEIAFSKYFEETRGIKSDFLSETIYIEGNRESLAFQILLGEKNETIYSDTLTDKQVDEWINSFNKSNRLVTVSTNGNKQYAFSTETAEITLFGGHAYAVKGADKNNVFLVNPHNTSKVLKIPREEFKKFFTNFEYIDL